MADSVRVETEANVCKLSLRMAFVPTCVHASRAQAGEQANGMEGNGIPEAEMGRL